MGRPATTWNGFWFAEGPVVSLGLFRILFACCLLAEVRTSRAKSVNAIDDGGFHLPYFDWIPPVSDPVYQLLHDLQIPLILLLALGLVARTSCAALLAIQGYLLLVDRLNFRNHSYLFLLLLLLLLLSPAAETLSLRGLARARRSGVGWLSENLAVRRPLTFQRLLQVQVCLTYFLAGLHKLHPAYLRGDVLGDVLGSPSAPLAALAGLAVALELWLPFGLWMRKTRPLSILLGISFHLAIAWTLSIHAFSFAMIASYLLFLDPNTLPDLLRPGRVSSDRRPLVD